MDIKSLYKKGGMFEGANHLAFGFAKKLRKEMTDAEKILWVYTQLEVILAEINLIIKNNLKKQILIT